MTRKERRDNSRNGYSRKTVQGSLGELEINVPSDRKGEFEPQLVKKRQTDVSAIEDKVISCIPEGFPPGISRRQCVRCTE